MISFHTPKIRLDFLLPINFQTLCDQALPPKVKSLVEFILNVFCVNWVELYIKFLKTGSKYEDIVGGISSTSCGGGRFFREWRNFGHEDEGRGSVGDWTKDSPKKKVFWKRSLSVNSPSGSLFDTLQRRTGPTLPRLDLWDKLLVSSSRP